MPPNGTHSLHVALVLAVAVTPVGAQEQFEFTELHMGVAVRITLHANDARHAATGARAAYARIAELEDVMSDYRPASELRRLSNGSQLSDDLFDVLGMALRLACETDGAFDPTVGPLTALWREARTHGRLPDAAQLAAARQNVGWQFVTLDSTARTVTFAQPLMRLDLGGIAKGYMLDEAARHLETAGVTQFLIEAGGDVIAGDAPPSKPGWIVAAPEANDRFRRLAASLTNAALATSGPSEQFVEIDGARFSHVVDPRTGLGLTDQHTVFVIAPTGVEADGLATALSVLGPAEHAHLLALYPDANASLSGGH